MIDAIMTVLNAMLPWLLAVSAGVAAYCWWRSAVVVSLVPQNSGVGALLDGGLVSVDGKGRKFDMHKTLKAQSSWSRWAAGAACVNALAGVGGMLIKLP